MLAKTVSLSSPERKLRAKLEKVATLDVDPSAEDCSRDLRAKFVELISLSSDYNPPSSSCKRSRISRRNAVRCAYGCAVSSLLRMDSKTTISESLAIKQ